MLEKHVVFINKDLDKNYLPNGLGTIDPVVVFIDPYLYRFEAVIVYSKTAFGPESLSVAFIIVINSFSEAFELIPAKYFYKV